jgi:hypothetical protein
MQEKAGSKQKEKNKPIVFIISIKYAGFIKQTVSEGAKMD